MKFAYQRGGAPLLSWRNGPPRQSRAADAVALGSTLDGPSLDMPLPRPGAPEPLGCMGTRSGGLGCGGCVGDRQREYVVEVGSPSFIGGLVAGYFVAWLISRSRAP